MKYTMILFEIIIHHKSFYHQYGDISGVSITENGLVVYSLYETTGIPLFHLCIIH